MNFTRRNVLPLLTGAVLAPTLALAATNSTPAQPATPAALTPEQARLIAQEVFLWGMHPVALYHLRYIHAQNPKSPRFVGLGRFKWARQPAKALPRFVTTPNATTLYGLAVLDLSREPVVLTVSRPDERYWSVQMADNYSRWWHMIGSQFNAPGPVRRLFVGPNWSGTLPADFVGVEIVQSPADFAVAVARLALTDDTPEELKAINAFMDRITLMPLSQWLSAGRKDVRAEDVIADRAAYPTYPGMENVREPSRLRGTEFLQWVSLILNDPSFTKQFDGHKELEAFARFERLGLKAGQPFDPANLPAPLKAAVAAGIEDGIDVLKKQLAKAASIGKAMNGWSLATDLGYHDTDWTRRALAGYIAVLGPIPLRSHTAARTFNDASGQALHGQHRYTITFDLDDMPPVTEFWEMPLYDEQGFFVDNPIDRYSLNSYMLQRGKLHTADGKLVIYVQQDEPTDPDQRRNWLPSPNAAFQFTARFYGPRGPLIDASYAMPGIVRVG